MRLPQHLTNFFKDAHKLEKMSFEEVLGLSITEIRTVSDEFKLALLERNISTIEKIASLQTKIIDKLRVHVDINELNRAIVIAKIVISYIKGEQKQGKIIFTGLDNAGKTSILLSLNNIYHTTKEQGKLSPTVGASYEKISFATKIPLIVWDYGGQNSFRRLYLNDTRYWANLKLLFHIIDLQDEKRLNQSLEYLNEILKSLMELKETPEIIINLHKADPELIKSDERIKQLIVDTTNQVEKVVSIFPFPYYISSSSIYNREELLRKFSTALRRISPVSQILDGLLLEISRQIGASVISIFSEQGFLLAEHCDDHYKNNWESAEISGYILTGINSLIRSPEKTIYSISLSNSDYCTIFPIELEEKVYCSIISNSLNLPVESIDQLKSYLKVWLYNLISFVD